MIKVGQIYKAIDGHLRSTVVVTNVENYKTHNEVDYISKHGVCFCQDDAKFLLLHRELIAEYPTWQEAVNSPEFNEVHNA